MKNIITLILFVITVNSLFSQNITVSGYVSDESSSEKLIGTYIFTNNDKVIQTNEFGFYSVTVPSNKDIVLEFKHLGFYSQKISINSNKNIEKNIYLKPNTEIDEITISARHKNNLDYYAFDAKEIRVLPCLTSEKDVVKSLQLMPGVQSGYEGTSDLYVRGGTPDQNLILLDDIPLHFINHIGGFVSIFDVNSINDLKLYKAGIPVKYGGHLSSVLDIRLKDGNMKKLEGEFSLGFISAKISLQGPIVKDKVSFLFSARKSNFDVLSWAFYKTQDFDDNLFMFYSFYDINTKFNYKISEKDKIDFTIYSSIDINRSYLKDTTKLILDNDIEEYIYSYKNTWGNYLNSFRWTHKYNNKLFQKTTLGYTKYQYNRKLYYKERLLSSDTLKAYANATYFTRIQDFIFKTDFDYFINNSNRLNFGLFATSHIYEPGNFTSEEWIDSPDTIYAEKKEQKRTNYDLNLYVDYSLKLDKIRVNAGILANVYYIEDAFYPNIQPRIKFIYSPTKNIIFNASYDRTIQNIHILTMSSSIVPADIWVPATKIAPPEKGNQYSVGVSANFFDNKITISPSAFYKKSNNLIDFQKYFYADDTIKNPTWEQQIVTNGTAEIYGFEFLFELKLKKIKSWISYTYMKNYRTFEDLNNGEPFPFTFDRRHNLQFVFTYNFTEHISLAATFMYGSGYPVSLPINQMSYFNIAEGRSNITVPNGGEVIPVGETYSAINTFDNQTYFYGSLNSYRMPDYHTLNLAFNWSKEKKRGVRTWSFNIYNAYNRQNAYLIFLKKDVNRNKVNLYKFTLFPIIPSVSYSLKF